MGHGCYLPKNYVWCRSRLDDGKVERRAPIVGMNGHEILEQLDQLEFSVMSKHPSLRKERELLIGQREVIFFNFLTG